MSSKPLSAASLRFQITSLEGGASAPPSLGPCAKKRVVCTLVHPEHGRWVGTNDVRRPQDRCPREPGEGYGPCILVCDQPAHAEVDALKQAGDRAKGAVAYLEGIGRVCSDCQQALAQAGVLGVVFEAPPP